MKLTLVASVLFAIGIVLYLMHSPLSIAVYGVPAEVPAAHWVEQGDSLWAIARQYFPGAHTGKEVHRIKTLNPDLGTHIFPGQKILLR